MKQNILISIIITFTVYILSGCNDELIINTTQVGEGEAIITASMEFDPMIPAIDNTRGSSGDALDKITSLHVIVYDSVSGEKLYNWKIDNFNTTYPKVDENNTEGNETGNESPIKVTFDFPERIPFGTYYIYAVANIPDLFDDPKVIETRDNLKGMLLTWDNKDISKNGQMIGYFTSANQANDEKIIINKNNESLHSWLRRVASKVTVAYDGSNLNDGVKIYPISASIKDIPAVCYLGNDYGVSDKRWLIAEGDEIKYIEGEYIPGDEAFFNKYTDDLIISNKSDIIGSDHSEKDESLFFFENMQGVHNDKDKRQQKKDENPNELKYNFKDGVELGTYIEVVAYYVSTNIEKPGEGIIKYRFMLGKDIKFDYNAQRNHHYKLTLKFNKFANDPDWHIVYENPVLTVTEPKIFNYQGKVFIPDHKWPNLGHEFTDINTVTVECYKKADNDIMMNDFEILYKDLSKGDSVFSSSCDWLEVVGDPMPGDYPYQRQVSFRVKEDALKPDASIDIDANLQNKGSKGTKDNPWNLADPNGVKDNIVCTANCYIVDSPGWYIIPLVYGNAIHNGTKNENSYTYTGAESGEHILTTFKNHLNKPITSPYIKENEGCNPRYAYYIWQDVNNLLQSRPYWESAPSEESPTYIPEAYNIPGIGSIGGIRFHITEDETILRQGNATIAISDEAPIVESENAILKKFELPKTIWSWHIWVTNFDGIEKEDEFIEVTAHDNNRKFKFMPVNLGWCSEPGVKIPYYKGRKCEVKFVSGKEHRTIIIEKKSHIAFTRGNNPYYQWGRKDPFIGAEYQSKDEAGNIISKNKTRYDYIGWDHNETILRFYDDDTKDADGNPVKNNGLFPNEERKTTREILNLLIQYPDVWQNPPRKPGINGNPYASDNLTYSNLWEGRPGTSYDADILKTVYDPCPVGYQISHYNAFTGFTTTGDNTTYSPEWYDVRPENISDYNVKEGLYEFYTNPDKYQSIIFPLTGYRDWDAQALTYHFSNIGYIWAAGNVKNDDNNSYNFEFSRYDNNGYVRPKNYFYPCDGFPVRPCYNGAHGL